MLTPLVKAYIFIISLTLVKGPIPDRFPDPFELLA